MKTATEEPRGKAWTDERVETLVGRLLRTGVILAAVVVLAGGALYLVRHGGASPDYRIFRGEPADLRTIAGIAGDALGLNARGVIQLGLLLLVATPVARVALSVVGFLRERDPTYVAVTLIVLSLLLFSLIGGGL